MQEHHSCHEAKIGFLGMAFDKKFGAHNDIDLDEGKRQCDMAEMFLSMRFPHSCHMKSRA